MDHFVVSARKYRPSTFETVVGQSSITTTLKNAIRNKHLAQAFLFCGPRGVGKTTCARILAKTINCTNLTPDTEGCNQCESCVSFNNGQSLNIFELDAASNNTVDDIRNLVEQVRYPPHSGQFKIYIIDEVHMLSTAAFNAFLKTLEEPPPYAIFILATTEKHKIIPTILSRCQIFDFNRITIDDIASHLGWIASQEGVNAEPEALHTIAQKADGALRDALSIFDQIVSFAGDNVTYKHVIDNLNILDYDYYFRLTDLLLQGNYNDTLLLLDEVISEGFEIHHFILGLGNHFRDLLVSRDPATTKLLEVGPSTRDRYKSQASQCSPSLLYSWLHLANRCDVEFKSVQNQRLHLEITLLKMCAPAAGLVAVATTAGAGVAAAAAAGGAGKSAAAAGGTGAAAAAAAAGGTAAAAAAAGGAGTGAAAAAAGGAGKSAAAGGAGAGAPTAAANTSITGGASARPIEDPGPRTGSQPAAAATATVPTASASPNPKARPSTISINRKLAALKEPAKADASAVAIEEADSSPFVPMEPAILARCWKEMAEKIRSEGRMQLAVTLSSQTPALLENNCIELPVMNEIQAEEIKNARPELLSFLKTATGIRHIDVTARVMDSGEASETAYTPLEKFKKMAEKNPDLNQLRQQFDLELDF